MSAQPKLILGAGGTEVEIKLTAKPSELTLDVAGLFWNGRPLLDALWSDILDPFLASWARRPEDRRSELSASLDAAMNRCVVAFRACSPERGRRSDHAVIAALAVTANLQRTLMHLGETLVQAKRRGVRRETVILSRSWCGMVPRRKRAPAPGPHQFKPLVRALGCSPAEIDARCRDALSALRRDLETGTYLARDDVATAPRRAAAEPGFRQINPASSG